MVSTSNDTVTDIDNVLLIMADTSTDTDEDTEKNTDTLVLVSDDTDTNTNTYLLILAETYTGTNTLLLTLACSDTDTVMDTNINNDAWFHYWTIMIPECQIGMGIGKSIYKYLSDRLFSSGYWHKFGHRYWYVSLGVGIGQYRDRHLLTKIQQ